MQTQDFCLVQVKLLKDGEAAGVSARPRRPRALVLGPTRELTDQLLRVAKSMSHHAKFRSTCINGGAFTALTHRVATLSQCQSSSCARSMWHRAKSR